MNWYQSFGLWAAVVTLGLYASAQQAVDSGTVQRQILQAEYHVREFEKEVELQKGGEKRVWRSKQDAVSRVRRLKEAYPNDPNVDKLFLRVRTALMKSKGDFTEVAAEWTAYKRNEETLRKTVAKLGETEWKRLLGEHAGKVLEKATPWMGRMWFSTTSVIR